MIEKLMPYPGYQESGLTWIGEIPQGWEVRRNGRLFTQRNETGRAELPVLEVSLRTIESIETARMAQMEEIRLLQELRARLISDLVTGKLDAREAIVHLPVMAEADEALDGGEPALEDEEAFDEAETEEVEA